MPQFVVLIHNHPHLHWDFMLEVGESLRTWRLSLAPNSPGEISAELLDDHRRDYLDYEGPVSGNRGEVSRFDRGEYVTVEETRTHINVQLDGETLKGTVVLETVDAGRGWTFNYNAD